MRTKDKLVESNYINFFIKDELIKT